jgi:hypothetical protein
VLDEASVRLLPQLARRLEGQVADELADQVRKVARFTWLRSQMLVSATVPALDALRAAEIPVMLVKGAAVVSHAGMSMTVRPMDDLDVMIPASRLQEATHVLLATGFHADLAPLTGNRPEAIVSSIHGLPFVDERGVSIDVHWHALHERLHPAADAACWRDARPAELRGVPCLVSSREDTLVHVIVHGAAWAERAPLQWATDATLLMATGAVDWDRVLRRARSHRLGPVLASGFAYLRDLGAAGFPDDLVARLRTVPRTRTERAIERGARARGRAGRAARDVARSATRTAAPGAALGPRLVARDLARTRRALNARPPSGLARVAYGETVSGLLRGDGTGCPHLVAGWEYPEPHGTWSGASRARIVLPLAESADGALLLEAELVPMITPRHPRLEVGVRVNGRRVVRWPFHGTEPMAERRSAWIAPAAGRRVLDVLLDVRDPVSGTEARYNSDARRLGVALRWLRVLRP